MRKLFLVMLTALLCTVSFAQTKVTGTVTSAKDGQPIAFASIVVKGTMNGVSANDDGVFEIQNVPANGVLQFSSIGYVTLDIPVNGRSVINAVMSPDAESLEETFIVAYGTAKKGTYTGAASVVKSDALKDVPSVSFEQALNGKVAGLQMTQSSGQSGSTSSIRIRGIGSMNASNEPLYVIDGVPTISGDIGQMSDYTYSTNNVMSTINPSDIESITVLKDAAASALYGSRAANGVIMITTKRGKSGRPTITFKASVGITPDWATANYETATVEQNAEMLYEVFWDYASTFKNNEKDIADNALNRINGKFKKHGYIMAYNGTGRYDGLTITALTDGQNNRTTGEYFDWDNALFRTGVYQTYDLSASGGNETSNYYSSISYTKDQGRISINEYSRISGRLNLNQKVGKHVEFATNVSLASTDRSGYNDTRNTGGNYFMQTRNLLWGLYWPTSYVDGSPWTARYGSYAQNNVYYNNLWENASNTLRVSASETLTAHIIDGLDAKTVFSFDNTETKDHIYYDKGHFNATTVDGEKVASVNEMSTQVRKIVSSSTLNYNKTFAEKHTIGFLAGFEAESNETRFQRASGKNLSTSGLHTVSTAGVLDASGYSWGNAMMSMLSRLEYNYADKYYVSGSFRRDGSSRLSPKTRWGNFWSAAGSWRINNEEFMKDLTAISNLRLRASYGVNGTLPSSNYGWRALASYSNKYMEQPGGSLANVASDDLTWETSYTYNLALEFGLFDQRITGTVEYFNRDSKNLLQNVPISTVTGFSSTLRNVGEVNNNGLEIELGGDIIRTNDIKWNVSANASFIHSKVTSLYNGEDIIWYDPTGGDDRCRFIYREGESMLSVYGREWAGVDPQNGRNVWYTNNDSAEFQYNGRNASYDFNDADLVIVGDLTPKVYGGINSDFSWKGLSLNLNFTYKIGTFYDGCEKDTEDDGYYWERIRSKREYELRWTHEGQVTDVPRLSGEDWEDAMQTSNRHIHNGNFLRLKNVTLGYSLPKSVVKRVGLQNTRFYFSGQNILTLAAWKWVDPEVNNYGTRGWETPFGKTYTFGVEFSF